MKNTLSIGEKVMFRWLDDEMEEEYTIVEKNRDGTVTIVCRRGFMSKVFPEQLTGVRLS